MEQNMQIIAKKFWSIVRVMYFMLRKGISKAKLFAHLSMMMKRGKVAGKAAIYNLMFHHHVALSSRRTDDPHLSYPSPLNEYEFSCSNSPAFPRFHLPFHLNKRKHSSHTPPPVDAELVEAALEMIDGAAASPAPPGFRPSPVVKQLRITDSPFPLKDTEEDNHVDEAAEEFIVKFYKELKRQNDTA